MDDFGSASASLLFKSASASSALEVISVTGIASSTFFSISSVVDGFSEDFWARRVAIKRRNMIIIFDFFILVYQSFSTVFMSNPEKGHEIFSP
jgi:hypothetical protein